MSVPKINFTSSQVALIKRTLAKDANNNEFDIYLELCRARGLNPLLRHCYCLVMNKDKQEKRQMVVVVSIDGQRHLAERSGSYRPDERAPRFVIDESLRDQKTNPAGLVSAEVSIFKHSHGAWHQVTDISYWEEAAPLKETWEGGQPSGKFALDTKKDGWRRMPRLMLAKVAEMKVLRKAFPDDFSGLYGEAEMDRGEVLDAAPSEIAEQAEQEARLNKIGGAGRLIVDWMNDGPLDAIPVGQFFDRAAELVTTRPADVTAWKDRNRVALKEYWAVAGGDALELKKLIEAAELKAKAITVHPISADAAQPVTKQ